MAFSSSIYKGQPITLMAHVPEIYDGYIDKLFIYLDRFVKNFSLECPIEQERWERTSDKYTSTTSVYLTKNDSKSDRFSKVKDLKKDAQCLTISAEFIGYNYLSNLRIFSTINKSNFITIPIREKERTTRIDIPYKIWRKADSAHFIDYFIEFCNQIGATYGCADVGLLSQTNIYNGAFYLFSKDAQRLSIEESLPGIHWGQYVNINRIQKTVHNKEEINSRFDFASVKSIDSENVWIQLNEGEIDNPSRQIRQKFRCFFKESLPDVDEQEIKNCEIPHIKRCLPFLIPEIEGMLN
ncbi:MAG: hypothetical protein K5663_00020 [Clostridiales bacterium]|nr:hypothetical protein [Clostridiales bacterium]